MIDGVGFVGVTDAFRDFLLKGDYGVKPLDEIDTVKRHARSLRRHGARRVAVLSHLGLGEMAGRRGARVSDRQLAAATDGKIDLIIGAHSHDLLPEGERVGDVLIAHAGVFGQHLGRIDITDTEMRASVILVTDDIAPDPAVRDAATRAEAQLDASLNQVIAKLDRPLDAAWIADMLRQRMNADHGLATSGAAIDHPLPAGPLRRGDLWEACHSTGNPGVVSMTGEQLLHVIERGSDPPSSRRPPGRYAAARAARCTSLAHRTFSRPAATWSRAPTGNSNPTAAWSNQPGTYASATTSRPSSVKPSKTTFTATRAERSSPHRRHNPRQPRRP